MLEEELGGAEMHASVSGLAEYLAENDGHAVQMCRELLHRLQWNKDCATPNRRSYCEPLYDAEDLLGEVMEESLEDKDKRFPKPGIVLDMISMAANTRDSMSRAA